MIMYKYTPASWIVTEMNRLTYPNSQYLDYAKTSRLLKTIYYKADYNDEVQFHNHFRSTLFYSKTKVKHVPVGSALLPVNLFDVTEIGD